MIKRLRLWFLATFHLDDAAVCEMSQGPRDYHDYQDSEFGQPFHFCTMPCKRCGKQFSI